MKRVDWGVKGRLDIRRFGELEGSLAMLLLWKNGRTSLLLVGLPQGISNPGPILSPLVHDGALENLIWKGPKREESRAPVLVLIT